MKRKTFWAFIAPSVISMVSLMIIPMFLAIWFGFHSFGYWTLDAPKFVGLENYRDILVDPRFWQAVQFTLLIIAIVTPVEIIIGSIVALLLDQIPKGRRGIFIALCLTTYVSIPIVAAYMFRGLFQANGLGSWLYEQVMGQRLILNESTVKTLILVYGVWRDTPFVILVVFAGLQSLPLEQLEAAAIDGAGRLQQIRHVTLPHLAPLLIVIAIIVIMALYSVFDSVYVLTGMNPVYHADSIMTYSWRTATVVNQLGKANAMSLLTLLGLMVVLIPSLYRTWRRETAN